MLLSQVEYCASRADPGVLSSEYLATLGEKLHKDIRVFWTGPLSPFFFFRGGYFKWLKWVSTDFANGVFFI